MTMTHGELGENLAQLVWESFSDFIAAHEVPEAEDDEVVMTTAPDVVPEEVLILFMWVHTRTCQQAFAGRSDPAVLKSVLDEYHRALFEDLTSQVVPEAQLPLFEQRVSARYTEYYEAADDDSEGRVVEVAARRITTDADAIRLISLELAEATAAAAGPLRDYLEEVDLSAD